MEKKKLKPILIKWRAEWVCGYSCR